MRSFLLGLSFLATQAHAAQYVIVETATGHLVNRIIADPSYVPPTGYTKTPDTGQQLYVAPQPAPTMISAYDFINRFTVAEQAALVAVNPLWGIKIAAAGTIDVTNSTLLSDLDAAVASGALTSTREQQILNLGVTSP